MENKQTLRIYFEYGTKAKGLSFWSAFWDSRFSSKILQIAKELGIEQAICFNVSKGYFEEKAMELGIGETLSSKHPQCIELTADKAKIDNFLIKNKELLSAAKTYKILNEVIQIH